MIQKQLMPFSMQTAILCPFMLIQSVLGKKFRTTDFKIPVMPIFLLVAYNTKWSVCTLISEQVPFLLLITGLLAIPKGS